MKLQAEEEYGPFDDKGLPREKLKRPLDAVPQTSTHAVAYIEIDDVIPITREDTPDNEPTDIERRLLAD